MNDLLDEAVWIARNGTTGERVLGAFSGGKDSIAVKRVCEIAGLQIEWHYHNTTIDPPEVVRFIKRQHPDVVFDKPRYGYFFSRIRKKGIMPSRKHRWCCDEYKEFRGPLNTVWIVGERREESYSRSSRPVIGLQPRTRRVMVRPLANWDEDFLWDFIRSEKLSYPTLYDEGFRRLGCIGCPLSGRKNIERAFERWPKYRDKWIAAARYIYDKKAPWDSFPTFESYWETWLDGKL